MGGNKEVWVGSHMSEDIMKFDFYFTVNLTYH